MDTLLLALQHRGKKCRTETAEENFSLGCVGLSRQDIVGYRTKDEIASKRVTLLPLDVALLIALG